MLKSKTIVGVLAAVGVCLLTVAPARAISHEDVAKGAMDGAKGAADEKLDEAKDDAKAEAAESTGGMMDQIDSAQKAVDSGQKTIKAGQDTMEAAKGLTGTAK